MHDACTSAEETILRSTAVGHFPGVVSGAVRRTDMFKLPDSWAPAGSTPVGTIRDLLAFGAYPLRRRCVTVGGPPSCRVRRPRGCRLLRLTWNPQMFHPSGLVGHSCRLEERPSLP